MTTTFNFNNGWRFARADAFPLAAAIDKMRDCAGRCFYEPEYDDTAWERVTLPHTFSDAELFRARIKDSGSSQARTVGLYRKSFEVSENAGHKVLLEFEGVRQTCYVYVNGSLAGWQESGVAPFGIDISEYIRKEGENIIAVATDNTATRNIPFCIAETPNTDEVEPGSYLLPQEDDVPPERVGVGYVWNCNDFNPSLGGITRNVRIHFKPDIYITLPLYSNLRTKGVYIFADDFDLENNSAVIHTLTEIRNESDASAAVSTRIRIETVGGDMTAEFSSGEITASPSGRIAAERTIVPKCAYEREILPSGAVHYREASPQPPVELESAAVTEISAECRANLRFWSADDPYSYRVTVELIADGTVIDEYTTVTGFRKVGYSPETGVTINGAPVWLRGYAQRAANEWAAIGIAPEWLKDMDAELVRESNANHIRWMHVAAPPADIRACDRHGIICTQPAGDKECETFGRQWAQREELMRDVIIYFRNSPSILFWEAGNNSINAEHMRAMRLIKERLDPSGGRFMGCRTINTDDVLAESEYVGTMLNRHAARFLAEHGPVTETEYLREESPMRIWDDFSPPDYDYRTKWLGIGGMKRDGCDYYDLTSEELGLRAAAGYAEFFNDRIGGASGKSYYSAAAALCWTDSAQHGRQTKSENARMSGRVDPTRMKKQSFDVFRVMQSAVPLVKICGHFSYPDEGGGNYKYEKREFNGKFWEYTGEYAYRNPHDKTVYVFASVHIKRVTLKLNGRTVGVCEAKDAADTFVFAFPHIDITEHGELQAVAESYSGEIVTDTLRTVGAAHHMTLELHTAPSGAIADGADIIYADVAVRDKDGNVCPLDDRRIDFELNGEGVFLGGYNSGRFDGGECESVIHKPFVYAECGERRVFIRTAATAGRVRLTARAAGLPEVSAQALTHAADLSALSTSVPEVIFREYSRDIPAPEVMPVIPEAAEKYHAPDDNTCKILVNGQEPDTRGVKSLNKNGSIWGAVTCILDRIVKLRPDILEYSCADGVLTMTSGAHTIVARAGNPALAVDGGESLTDGAPFVTPSGIFVMEVTAAAAFIEGASVQWDERIGVLRIEI